MRDTVVLISEIVGALLLIVISPILLYLFINALKNVPFKRACKGVEREERKKLFQRARENKNIKK